MSEAGIGSACVHSCLPYGTGWRLPAADRRRDELSAPRPAGDSGSGWNGKAKTALAVIIAAESRSAIPSSTNKIVGTGYRFTLFTHGRSCYGSVHCPSC